MNSPNLKISEKPVHEISADTLILPTVADRLEDSDFHTDLYDRAGEKIVRSYKKKVPLRIGNVAVTGGGKTDVETIVHFPVQTAPDVPSTEENLQIGLRSALVTADEEGVDRLILPRMVPDDQFEEMDLESVAGTLIEDLIKYPPRHFSEIFLVAQNSSWKEILEREI